MKSINMLLALAMASSVALADDHVVDSSTTDGVAPPADSTMMPKTDAESGELPKVEGSDSSDLLKVDGDDKSDTKVDGDSGDGATVDDGSLAPKIDEDKK